jgi:hypothetical protein
MKYRKLRIAFSVGCGIACVLLAVLWIAAHPRLISARPGTYVPFGCMPKWRGSGCSQSAIDSFSVVPSSLLLAVRFSFT